MRRGLLTLLALASWPWTSTAEGPAPAIWLKGNLHTHTSRSDGDSPPEAVVRWYREHGYGFLALTDHDAVTDPAPLATAAGPGLVLVAAEEVTGLALPPQGGRVPVHVNALGPRSLVVPFKGGTPAAVLAENVTRARAASAVVLVNHPNFAWALTGADLEAAPPFDLLEIFSGHPLIHHLGGEGAPPAEELWDGLLTSGRRVFGVAVDDSHHFAGECTPARACPGRGWVVARVAERTPGAVLDALRRGDFYASSGVELRDVRATGSGMEVDIEPQKGGFRYRTEFIGPAGRVVGTVDGASATWRFTGRESYVRARVTDSMGRRAWTQPAFASAR
jgi:hypothetical protein